MTDKQFAAGFDYGWIEGYNVGSLDGFAKGFDAGVEAFAKEVRGGGQ
jgi:hypothetical protein